MSALLNILLKNIIKHIILDQIKFSLKKFQTVKYFFERIFNHATLVNIFSWFLLAISNSGMYSSSL